MVANRRIPAVKGVSLHGLGVLGGDLPPLTILEAPLGYGKTRLLQQWMRNVESDLPVTYVSVEDKGWAQGLAAWAESLEAPAAAIIDDYHLVTNVAADRDLVRVLQINPNVYLLVSGRRSGLLTTPATTARVETCVLSSEDLTLSQGEVKGLVSSSDVVESSELWDHLQKAEGWPAAVRETIKLFGSKSTAQASASLLRLVADALKRNVIEEVAYLIYKTQGTSLAVLEAATGFPSKKIRDAVNALVERGLAVSSWRLGVPHYTLHPFAVAAVRSGLVPHVDEEQVALALEQEARERAVVDPLGSFEILTDHGLWHEVQSLIQENFVRFSVDVERVWPLVERLDESQLEQAPALAGLRFFLAYAHQKTDRETLEEWARQLKRTAEQLRLDAGESNLQAITLSLAANRILGGWEEAVQEALELEDHLVQQRHRGEPGKWTPISLLYEAIAFTGLLSGDLDLAERAALQGLYTSKMEGSPVVVDSAHTLALIGAARGNMRDVAHYLALAEENQGHLGMKPPKNSMASATIAKASLLMTEGDLEGAALLLEELKRSIVTIDAWEQFTYVEAWLTRYRAGNLQALHTLRERIKMLGSGRMSPKTASHLTAEAANLLIYQGDILPAEELLELPTARTPELMLSKARLAFAKGHPGEARRLTEQARQGNDLWSQNSIATLLGVLALHVGEDRVAALEELEELNLDVTAPVLDLILSTVPYEPLLDIAEDAAEGGNQQLLERVRDLPESLRFRWATPLSAAETRTLTAVAQQGTIKNAATHLDLSVNTIKSHLRQIYRKLGVSRRQEMIKVASARGLI